MKICAIEGCNGKHQARNMCLKHYTEYYRSTTRGRINTRIANRKFCKKSRDEKREKASPL